MMKKLYLLLILVSLFGFLAFGDTSEQEEIDFLLFLPNSGNRFVNEDQAMIQLDNVANYLMARSLSPGKISVYGYAAAVVNDIEPVNLSRDRALYVMNELQKRGLSEDLFAEPVAYGSVDLWGGNTDGGDRSLNRRVRILLDDTILTPVALQAAPKAVDAGAENPDAGNLHEVEVIQHEIATEETGSRFPWWIIPLALVGLAVIAAIIFFVSRRKRSSTRKIAQKTPIIISTRVVPPSPKIYVLTEEEIRRHAYELYHQRNGQDGDATQDWHRSMCELTAYYETQGYRVILYWERVA